MFAAFYLQELIRTKINGRVYPTTYNCFSLNFYALFTKLRKVTISFVRLFARMEQLGCHWLDFYDIWYLCIFSKICRKSQVSLKSYKNNG